MGKGYSCCCLCAKISKYLRELKLCDLLRLGQSQLEILEQQKQMD